VAIKIEDLDLLAGEVRSLKGMFIQLRDLVEGSIASNNLHANAVRTNNIKDDAITANKIIADAITADKIQALAIDSSKIAVGTITSDQIEDGTIVADKIKAGTLTALQISTGTITAGLLKTGGQAFSHNLTFTSTDANTVSWTAGTIKTADETAYSIDAGNTGNMTARTYIYLDKSVSETVLQTSTSYDAPLGDNRIPIATAEDGTNNAIFTVFQGGGGVFISGGMIAAHTIGATQIIAGSITANEITVSNLQSLSATIGIIHSGTIYGTRLKVGGGTNEDIYFEDSGVSMYDANNRLIVLAKTNYESLGLQLSSNAVIVGGDVTCAQIKFFNTGQTQIWCQSNFFNFYKTGTLQMPSLGATAPTAHTGDYAFKSISPYKMQFYNGSGWEYALDGNGW